MYAQFTDVSVEISKIMSLRLVDWGKASNFMSFCKIIYNFLTVLVNIWHFVTYRGLQRPKYDVGDAESSIEMNK